MAYRNWKQEVEDQRPPRPSPWPFVWRTGAAMLMLGGLTCGALWGWPGYLRPKPWVRPGPAPQAVTLLFTGDAAGYLEPCGCTQQRWGGVARLSGALQQIRRPEARVRLDVGDMAAGTQAWQRVGLEYYLTALARMGYTAANLGAAEAAMTVDDLRAVVTRSPVPLVSANVLDSTTGRPLVATHVQVMVSNLRVAVVGVVVPTPAKPPGKGLTVTDPNQALGALLPSLRPAADLIVLLASADEPTMRHLAQAHPELDVILGGQVVQASRQVEMVGACRLAWQTNKGQMLGRMDIQIRPDGQPGPATGVMMVLDNEIPEDPAMLELVAQYNGELSRLNRTGGLKALGVPVGGSPAGSNHYVGPEACRACHPQAYQTWRSSAHARAYDGLVRRQRDSNPDCISCHVMDMGAGDGFRGARLTPERTDVQCESCHGRAGDHVRARDAGMDQSVGKLPRVLATSCEGCHDCTHSPEFTYTSYWEKIRHDRN